jgi:hypothetical protein
MLSRSVSAIAAEEREQHAAGAGRVVDARQRAGEHLQGDAVRGEVFGQGGELDGVAPEPFHLVDGEDDLAVRGVGLDLSAQLQRGLEPRSDPDPAGDLLGEDLLPVDAVVGERVELALQLLGQVRAAGVADADVGDRGVGGQRCRRRCARPPQLPGASVGRGRHAQPLGQSRDLHEPARVVGAGDGARPGSAR